jgi:hypothetical protein
MIAELDSQHDTQLAMLNFPTLIQARTRLEVADTGLCQKVYNPGR